MTEFTPLTSAFGGMLIGLAVVLLMGSLGRIAGISGIVGTLFSSAPASEKSWRAAFLVGMIAAPTVLFLITGAMPVIEVPPTTAMLVIGGVLVGIGVSFGNGCTSGHGVCGMARLSGRSIAATLTFMATTAATVYILRHVIGG